MKGCRLGTRGGMIMKHTFPLDGEYQIAGGGGRGGGGGTDMTIDGQPVQVARGGRIQVKAGPHTIAVAVVDGRRAGGVDEQYSDYRVNSKFAVGGGVQGITITGPVQSQRNGRHAKPSPDFRVYSSECQRGNSLCPQDRFEPGAPRFPAKSRR